MRTPNQQKPPTILKSKEGSFWVKNLGKDYKILALLHDPEEGQFFLLLQKSGGWYELFIGPPDELKLYKIESKGGINPKRSPTVDNTEIGFWRNGEYCLLHVADSRSFESRWFYRASCFEEIPLVRVKSYQVDR